jgi:hypothetical protein
MVTALQALTYDIAQGEASRTVTTAIGNDVRYSSLVAP